MFKMKHYSSKFYIINQINSKFYSGMKCYTFNGLRRTRLKLASSERRQINLLKPTGHVIQEQFNIQQLYVLPTLY